MSLFPSFLYSIEVKRDSSFYTINDSIVHFSYELRKKIYFKSISFFNHFVSSTDGGLLPLFIILFFTVLPFIDSSRVFTRIFIFSFAYRV